MFQSESYPCCCHWCYFLFNLWQWPLPRRWTPEAFDNNISVSAEWPNGFTESYNAPPSPNPSPYLIRLQNLHHVPSFTFASNAAVAFLSWCCQTVCSVPNICALDYGLVLNAPLMCNKIRITSALAAAHWLFCARLSALKELLSYMTVYRTDDSCQHHQQIVMNLLR